MLLKLKRFVVLTAFLFAAVLMTSPVQAEPGMPNENERDILIISTLLRFNDANLSGDYSVLHALAAPEFKKQISVEKLSNTFKPFRDQGIDISELLISEFFPDENGEKSHGNLLELSGYSDLTVFRVEYDLGFKHNGSQWQLISIDVKANS